MKAVTDIRYYDSIAKSINYSKTADYKSELATNTEYFNDIGEAIVSKDGGEMPDKSEMANRIEAIPTGSPTVLNPALVLWDWGGGTKLAEYSAEDALALTELPAPSTLPSYTDVDHELLLFQKWNCSLANIKTWIQNHEGETRDVGAIYITVDGQDHNYWGNPRLDTATTINVQKRGTASIGSNAFQLRYSLTKINIPDGVTSIGTNAFNSCYSLTQINIPDSVTSIGTQAFQDCRSLTKINIPDSVTSIGDYAFFICYSLTQINIPGEVTSISDGAFKNCVSLCDVLLESKPALANTNALTNLPSNYRIYVPRSDLSWFETETNWSTVYTEGHIVTIEDYIDYLESIGFNVDKYKEV